VVVCATVVDGTTVDGATVEGRGVCPVVDGTTVEEAGSTLMVGGMVVAVAIEVSAGRLVVVVVTEEGLFVLRTRAAAPIVATMMGTIMVAAILILVSSFSRHPTSVLHA
jgi:hypothetical protein